MIWEFRSEVDRIAEQKNICNYWNEVQRIKDDEEVNIQIIYVPYVLEEVCQKKSESHIFEDYWLGNSVDSYIRNGEILDCFWYDTFKRRMNLNGKREVCGEDIRKYKIDIEEYTKNPNKEWDYWY